MFFLMINDFYIFGCLLIKIVVSCYMRAKNKFFCVECVKCFMLPHFAKQIPALRSSRSKREDEFMSEERRGGAVLKVES